MSLASRGASAGGGERVSDPLRCRVEEFSREQACLATVAQFRYVLLQNMLIMLIARIPPSFHFQLL